MAEYTAAIDAHLTRIIEHAEAIRDAVTEDRIAEAEHVLEQRGTDLGQSLVVVESNLAFLVDVLDGSE